MQKELSNHGDKVVFYYIDIEKFPEVAEMLQVSSVPHVFSVKGGEIVDEFQGVVSDKNISEFYQKAISGTQWIHWVYLNTKISRNLQVCLEIKEVNYN